MTSTAADILSKEQARIEGWGKELAPSITLRKWLGHLPAKRAGLRPRCRKELAESGEIEARRESAMRSRHEAITLIYSAAEEHRNQDVALKELLGEVPSARAEGR
jgi:uncharacterized protein YeaO (DUF488 family)